MLAVPPIPTSEFVGRDAEFARIAALLDGGARLITLVGPGGIGKTRLAAEALHERHAARHRPVHWARLARLARDSEVGVIAEEVARSLGPDETAGRSAWDVLVDTVGDQATVLVLDNCEHVRTGAGLLITNLLAANPELIVIATSREPILDDEHTVNVRPLPPEQAVALFRRRAEMLGRSVAHQPAEQICRRVDNNPLFIQLAAGRLRYQPPAGVLRELTGGTDDKRMQWSHAGRFGVEHRHSGIRDAIAWSYQLCDDEERLLLERMSVFAAGYETDTEERRAGAELEAIAAVCADPTKDGEPALPRETVERLLERLVERSLVSAHMTSTSVHYYLLDSVRIFAADRLRAGAGAGAIELAVRHRRHYRDKIVAEQTNLSGTRERDFLAWARPAWDNILVAIESSLTDPAEAVTGLEIATTLMSLRAPFASVLDQPLGSDGGRTIPRLAESALVATRHTAPTGLRVTAMSTVAWITLWQNKSEYAARLLDDCVAEWTTDRDLQLSWRDTADADIGLPAPVEFARGLELLVVHVDPRALPVLARARRKFTADSDRSSRLRARIFEMFANIHFGTPEAAAAAAQWFADHAAADRPDTMPATEPDGSGTQTNRREPGTSLWALGFRIELATRLLADRVATGGNSAESRVLATELAHLVRTLETQQRSAGIRLDTLPIVAATLRRAAEVATSVVGKAAYIAAVAHPEPDNTLRAVPGRTRTDSVRSRWDLLSPAEREVGVMAAAGLPNSAIAASRGSSIRTVDAQVASIRQKLMVVSRTDIVWHVPDGLAEEVRRESQRRPSGR